MSRLKFYSEKQLSRFIAGRPGETKLGEKIQVATGLEDLKKSTARFVIFGIPEDIGVRANYGKTRGFDSMECFFKSFSKCSGKQV